MKEFIGIARNVYQVVDEETGSARPMVELVITVSEPVPVIEDAEIMSRRQLSDIRFQCSVEAIKMLAVIMIEIVQSLEKLGLVKKKEDGGGQP